MDIKTFDKYLKTLKTESSEFKDDIIVWELVIGYRKILLINEIKNLNLNYKEKVYDFINKKCEELWNKKYSINKWNMNDDRCK